MNNSLTVTTPDGLSWNSAFADIQDAIDAGSTDTATEIEIWITGGAQMYKPTDSMGITPVNPRNACYVIPTVSKKFSIYGGFNGTETALSQRTTNLLFNHTTISGEIGNIQNSNDNLENLLLIKTGNFDNYTVLLDGIGFYSTYNNTGINGAVYNERYQTRFQNCYFGNNISNGEGAAIHSVGYNPTIDQCEFWDNQAMQGGAVYIGYNLSNFSHANIFNSRFVRNSAALGGAVKIDNLQCYVVNTEFIDNTSPFNGEGSVLS